MLFHHDLAGSSNSMNDSKANVFSIKRQGFTLIETVVVLAVLSIIVAMASITIINSLKQMEAKNVASSLMNFLSRAKQEALIYQNPVVACVASDSLACVTTGGHQLISFIDRNNNNSYEAAVDKLNHQLTLDLSWGVLTANISLNNNYIIFKPENARPIGYMGNIQYCPLDGKVDNRLKVSFSKTGIIKYKPYSVEQFNCP